jgi:hypothetical protein
MILYDWGVVKHLHDYYPFMLWQLTLGIPTLIGLMWWLSKKPTMSRWLTSYGLVLFVFWYFSRYFNNSHIAFISSIFILGILTYYDESSKKIEL